jgi:hypothetical protein
MEIQDAGVITVAGESLSRSTLRVDLVENVTAERLGALLTAVTQLYCLYRELETRRTSPDLIVSVREFDVPGSRPTRPWVRQLPRFADELIVSRLEIGTPNFIEWIGESKALKAIERALQAAAAIVTIVGFAGSTPYVQPPPDPPPVVQQYEDPFPLLNEALDFTIRAREAYLAGRITLEEYNRYMAMANAGTRDLLNGASVVKIGPPKEPGKG